MMLRINLTYRDTSNYTWNKFNSYYTLVLSNKMNTDTYNLEEIHEKENYSLDQFT